MFFKLLIFAFSIGYVLAESSDLHKLHPLMIFHKRKTFESMYGCGEDFEEGNTCMDCERSIYCHQTPNGQWLEYVDYCDEGRSCNFASGRCEDGDNSQCLMYDFPCMQAGVFPHPFDCKTYFVCHGYDDFFHPIRKNCNEGFAYDPLTTTCRIKIIGNQCTPPAEPCTEVGGPRSIIGNPQLYYVCSGADVDGQMVIIPHMYYCKNNEQFINGSCRDPTPPRPNLNSNGLCVETKAYSFPDAIDCSLYVTCIAGQAPSPAQCPPGQRFDGWQHKCVPFKC